MVAAATGLLHLLLVGWLTWPLPLHMATDLPDATIACRFDTLLIGWALAQETHALLTAPSTFGQANIFHPARYTLYYGEAAFGALPYFLPVFAWTGNPTLAINLVLLGCTAATAAILHLVIRRLTGSWLAGGVAAWAWLTAPWTLWTWVPSAPGYAVMQYLPIIMVCAWRPLQRRRDVIGLAGLLALQSLTSVYAAVSTMFPVALLVMAMFFTSLYFTFQGSFEMPAATLPPPPADAAV